VEATNSLQEAALADHHQRMLEIDSAISPKVVAERGYFTVIDSDQLREMGFADYQLRVPALAIPVFGVGASLGSTGYARTILAMIRRKPTR
jgi:hypothetical protein